MSAVAGKERAWSELRARDVMETRVVTVSTSSPLCEVERLLTEHRISGMPVTDPSGRAVGVVSYRDLLDHYAVNGDASRGRDAEFFRSWAEHLPEREIESICVPEESGDTAADVMTPAIVDVTTDATMQEVCRTMARHSVHRVLV